MSKWIWFWHERRNWTKQLGFSKNYSIWFGLNMLLIVNAIMIMVVKFPYQRNVFGRNTNVWRLPYRRYSEQVNVWKYVANVAERHELSRRLLVRWSGSNKWRICVKKKWKKNVKMVMSRVNTETYKVGIRCSKWFEVLITNITKICSWINAMAKRKTVHFDNGWITWQIGT